MKTTLLALTAVFALAVTAPAMAAPWHHHHHHCGWRHHHRACW